MQSQIPKVCHSLIWQRSLLPAQTGHPERSEPAPCSPTSLQRSCRLGTRGTLVDLLRSQTLQILNLYSIGPKPSLASLALVNHPTLHHKLHPRQFRNIL